MKNILLNLQGFFFWNYTDTDRIDNLRISGKLCFGFVRLNFIILKIITKTNTTSSRRSLNINAILLTLLTGVLLRVRAHKTLVLWFSSCLNSAPVTWSVCTGLGDRQGKEKGQKKIINDVTTLQEAQDATSAKNLTKNEALCAWCRGTDQRTSVRCAYGVQIINEAYCTIIITTES